MRGHDQHRRALRKKPPDMIEMHNLNVLAHLAGRPARGFYDPDEHLREIGVVAAHDVLQRRLIRLWEGDGEILTHHSLARAHEAIRDPADERRERVERAQRQCGHGAQPPRLAAHLRRPDRAWPARQAWTVAMRARWPPSVRASV